MAAKPPGHPNPLQMADRTAITASLNAILQAAEASMKEPASAAAIAAERIEGEAGFLNRVEVIDKLLGRGLSLMKGLEENDDINDRLVAYLYVDFMLGELPLQLQKKNVFRAKIEKEMKVVLATEPKDITPFLWAKFQHGRELLLRARASEIIYDEIQVEVKKRQLKEKENTES